MTPAPPRRRARGLLLPIVSGALLGATFQPWGLSLLSLVALVPLLVALHRVARAPDAPLHAGFRAGYAAGLAYFLVLLHWIPLLESSNLPHPIVMIPLFLLLVLYLALYPGLFGLLLVAAARRTRFPFTVLAPALWLAAEWLRGVGELTFPWGYVGYALVARPTILQCAAWVGIHGLSLVVLLANVAVWAAVVGRGRARFAPAAAAIAGLLALHAAGAARLGAHPPLRDAAVRVAVVQPNIVQTIKWDWEHKDRSLDALARLSHRIERGDVSLSVWPETAVPAYLRDERAYLTLVERIVEGTGAPTLVGFPNTEVIDGRREYYNAALLLNPDGSEGGEYRKIRLVPFGEALPFQAIFPALRRVDLGEADFTPGRDYTLFATPAGRFGVSICFEAVYPAMTRRLVQDGADFLVNITNDAWFGTSSAPWQHARMALVRAVEDGVSLVRSANTGISLVADPFGRITAETALFEEAILVEPLDVRRVPTFYLEHGDWCLHAALALAALAVVASALPVPLLARRASPPLGTVTPVA